MIPIGQVGQKIYHRALRKRFYRETFLLAACQSPIEEMFGEAVLRREEISTSTLCTEVDDVAQAAAASWSSRIFCASQVSVGRFSVDFLFGYCDLVGTEQYRLVAVECDGHDFHEKTKQQAARDKARDREIMARDIRVFRFTGSEIWWDADGCVAQIIDVLKREPIKFPKVEFEYPG